MKNSQSLIPFAQRGDTARVIRMLRDGVDPDVRDASGWTALHWAAQGGFLDLVKCLVQSGAKTDLADNIGFTPLLVATGEDHHAIVRELLLAGAAVNKRNPADGNRTALHLACSLARLATASVLLETPDLDMNIRDDEGNTPLAFAIKAGATKLVADLRKRGAIA